MRPRRECALVAPMLGAREGELIPDELRLRDAHVEGCDACRALAADLAASDGLFAEAMLARAARVDFAPFVDAVMERVGAVPGERPGAWDRLLGWARAHRAAALAGTLAPTLAAAALVVYFSAASVGPLAGEIEVVAEGRTATVLQTVDGPVVLLGDDDELSGT